MRLKKLNKKTKIKQNPPARPFSRIAIEDNQTIFWGSHYGIDCTTHMLVTNLTS